MDGPLERRQSPNTVSGCPHIPIHLSIGRRGVFVETVDHFVNAQFTCLDSLHTFKDRGDRCRTRHFGTVQLHLRRRVPYHQSMMLLWRVSGRKKKPMTRDTAAIITGYQTPA